MANGAQINPFTRFSQGNQQLMALLLQLKGIERERQRGDQEFALRQQQLGLAREQAARQFDIQQQQLGISREKMELERQQLQATLDATANQKKMMEKMGGLAGAATVKKGKLTPTGRRKGEEPFDYPSLDRFRELQEEYKGAEDAGDLDKAEKAYNEYVGQVDQAIDTYGGEKGVQTLIARGDVQDPLSAQTQILSELQAGKDQAVKELGRIAALRSAFVEAEDAEMMKLFKKIVGPNASIPAPAPGAPTLPIDIAF